MARPGNLSKIAPTRIILTEDDKAIIARYRVKLNRPSLCMSEAIRQALSYLDEIEQPRLILVDAARRRRNGLPMELEKEETE